MRAKQVVGGPERIVRTHDIRECFVQKVYPDAEIRHCGGAAPSSHAGRSATAPHRQERVCRAILPLDLDFVLGYNKLESGRSDFSRVPSFRPM